MLYSNTRTTPRSKQNWLVSAATDVWSTTPPPFRILRPHMSIPVVMTSRIWRWTDGVKRFRPAVRHIHVKRNQLNAGSLNVDSRTENRLSLIDCVIQLTAVRRSGHWLQSRQFMAVRWLHTNQTASCFDCWELLCVCVGYRRKCRKEGWQNDGN